MKREVEAGKLYELTKSGLVEARDKEPSVWACRRVEDFPEGAIAKLPTAGFASCSHCQARIVYNTERKVEAPKVCMQCMGIEPDPYPQ